MKIESYVYQWLRAHTMQHNFPHLSGALNLISSVLPILYLATDHAKQTSVHRPLTLYLFSSGSSCRYGCWVGAWKTQYACCRSRQKHAHNDSRNRQNRIPHLTTIGTISILIITLINNNLNTPQGTFYFWAIKTFNNYK